MVTFVRTRLLVAAFVALGLTACQPTGTEPTIEGETGAPVSPSTTVATTASTTPPPEMTSSLPTTVVVEADNAQMVTPVSRSVLTGFSINWVQITDIGDFNSDRDTVGVLSETGEGPACWTVSTSTLLIVDQIQNRALTEDLQTGNRAVFELDFDGSVVDCHIQDAHATLLVAVTESGSQHTQVRTFDLATGQSIRVAEVRDSIAAQIFEAADAELWFSYLPITDDLSNDIVFTRITAINGTLPSWEIRPGHRISLLGGSAARVTIESGVVDRVWWLGSSSDVELVLLDAVASDSDVMVLGLSPGMIHVWRLSDNEITVEFGVDISLVESFGRVRSEFVVDDGGAARLFGAEVSDDQLMLVEYRAK